MKDQRAHPSQIGFRLGRGCIDRIRNLRRTLEQRWCYEQPTAVFFIGLVAFYGSVDRGFQAIQQSLIRINKRAHAS